MILIRLARRKVSPYSGHTRVMPCNSLYNLFKTRGIERKGCVHEPRNNINTCRAINNKKNDPKQRERAYSGALCVRCVNNTLVKEII
jgi:ribosomal protein L34E